MKEHPILFSAEMVRAILDGRKSQTRRVIKPQPIRVGSLASRRVQKKGDLFIGPNLMPTGSTPGLVLAYAEDAGTTHCMGSEQFCAEHCPHGQPGDRLWVKETWKPHCEGPISEQFPLGTCVKYRADGKCVKPTTWTNEQGAWCEMQEESTRWRPSIFMPRWASRLTLEITEIRVQRVQEITPDDCRAEGQPADNNDIGVRYGFGQLWNTINAQRGFGWDTNPYVWAITFKRL